MNFGCQTDVFQLSHHRQYLFVVRHFMKPYLIILVIFIGTLFLCFKPVSNQIVISGQILKRAKGDAGWVENIMVFVKADTKVLAKTVTDENGRFKLTFIQAEHKPLDFFCNGVGIDTMLLASLKTFAGDTSNITFYLPAEPKKNNLGKVICLKCKRADKVYKIVYGDNPIVVRHINHSGDTTFSPLYKRTYQEDCSVQPAQYYCDRDKLKF